MGSVPQCRDFKSMGQKARRQKLMQRSIRNFSGFLRHKRYKMEQQPR